MKTRMRCVLAVLTAASLSMPGRIRAQEPDKVAAKQFFQAGKKLLSMKKYRQAIDAFQKAYKYWKHRVLFSNIAPSYAYLGKKAEAGDCLRKYLKKATFREKRLPKVLREVLQQTGVLEIRTQEPDAEIIVDGRVVRRGTAERVVVTGQRAVDIRPKDQMVARKVIAVPPNGRVVWEPLKKGGAVPAVVPRPADPAQAGKPPEGGTPVTVKRRETIRTLHWAYFAAVAGLAAAMCGAAVGMGFRTKNLRDDFLNDRTNGSLRDKAIQSQNITNAFRGGGRGSGAVRRDSGHLHPTAPGRTKHRRGHRTALHDPVRCNHQRPLGPLTEPKFP